MNQVSVDEPFIRVKGEQLFTTSIDVAEKFGKRHDTVLRAIRKTVVDCGDGPARKIECGSKLPARKIGPVDFASANFNETTYLDDQNQRRPMFEMTRSGFTILAMGFTGAKALQWKIKYEQAFSAMEAALLNQKNLSWQEQRQHGKIARHDVTDRIQDFIAYAELQGSRHAHHYYKHITTATYRCLVVVTDQAGKSFRDMLDSMQLSFLQVAEYVAAKAITDGMSQGLFYKDIYKLAKERIESYASQLPRTEVVKKISGPLPLIAALNRQASTSTN